MAEENKTYYLYVKGQRVEVSEEIYRSYVQPEWQRKKRDYRSKEKVCVSSIEGLSEKGFEIEDKTQDFETALIADEEHAEELSNLHAAIAQLSDRDRQIVQLYYFESKTQQEIASILGVSQQAVQKRLDRILERLKNFF
ncbi:MAG: sigma-70 family RNA polymerase sigma factor [Ruminococcus flavefaciens]|nr:sigma-70 family RNA polymerase sigma factor [Ruminococcus flavefaciens]